MSVLDRWYAPIQVLLRRLNLTSSQAIALQTFAVLVLRWRPPRHAGKTIIALIWLFVALDIGISNAVHRNDDYYGNTGYCNFLFHNHTSSFKTDELLKGAGSVKNSRLNK